MFMLSLAMMPDFAPAYPLISANWLIQVLDHPNVAIADCRFSLADPGAGRQQYQAGHIPGAFYFDLNQDLSSPVQRHGGRHPLPDPDQLAAKLAAAGVHFGETWVVAYDDSRFAFASRFWWLLRYLGHNRVVVLDGGFSGWLAAEYPTTPAIPKPRSGHFTPQVQPGQVVDRQGVIACRDNPQVVLVDAREPERYRGEREPIDPIAGHIPGAVNYPWQEVTDAQGKALPVPQQQQRWEAIAPTSEIIVYCGSGVTACVNLLSLELAGRTGAKLYPGSWSDWCSYL